MVQPTGQHHHQRRQLRRAVKETPMARSRLAPLAAGVLLLLSAATALGQAPTITSLSPSSAIAGGPAFVLTVNGTNFVTGATVNWNGAPLTTTFVSATQLTAQVPEANIFSAGAASVTVTNPGPATSAPATFTIVGQLTITTTTLPVATVGVAYSQAVTATGGTAPLTWSATSLPAWLTLNPSTGVLSGTPPAPATHQFTVQVTDSGTPTPQTASKLLAVTVNPAPLTITTTSPLPAGTVGAPYSLILAAAGGITPYTWSATGLPAWLTLNPATGGLTGTPSAPGTYNFTAQVSDSSTPTPLTASRAFALTVTPPPLSILTASPLPEGTVGASYQQTLTASGGTTPYNWSATGLPVWLVVNPSTGALSGIPAAPGPINFTVQVTDSAAPTPQTASKPFTVTFTSPTPVVTGLSPASAIAGGPGFSLTVNGTNFVSGAVVNWNATPLTTTFVSATQLTAAVPAANLASAGSAAITVSNPGPVNSTTSATFSIIAQLTITTTALPSGIVGVTYAATLQATGGTAPHTWSVPSGQPGWLTLNASTGALTGTPTAAGVYYFTVQVADGGTPTPQTASKPLSVTVASGLTVTTSTLPGGTVGTPYSQTLGAAGGTPPYSWAVTAGALPSGLILTAGGQLSGTPTTPGTSNFTVQVTDAASATASKALSITISAALTITTLSPLPDGVVGRAYSLTLIASGGTPPYVNWLVMSGALPPGLTLTAATGFLSGVPTAPGSFAFTVQVYDSTSVTTTKSFILTVSAGLAITTASLPGGATGVPYSQTLTAAGGTPPYTWSLASGSLPPGITLSAAGALSGTPTAPGSSTFTVRVTDSASVAAVRTFVLDIGEGLTVTTAAQLPGGAVGSPYTATLTASGGRSPYTWSVASGSLPPGLTLGAASGVLSGTPSSAGTYNFTVQVTDSSSPPVSATKTLSAQVSAGLNITTPAALPAGTVGTAYSYTLSATGGAAPYTWTVTQGQLPAGLSLNSSTGAISGTPTAAGSFTFTVQASDSAGRRTTLDLSLTVASGASAITITTEAVLPSGTVGASYSQTLSASGGTAPYSKWNVVSGILPGGLSLDSSLGRISGIPTAAGTLKFTVQVTDAAGGTTSKEFTLTIQAAALLVTTASSLPAGVMGQAYSHTLQASGGVPPYTWAVADGSLPSGLTLEASGGQIRGTPDSPGASSFTVQVTDSARRTASKALSLTVAPPALPAVQIVAPDTAEPAQQPAVRISLGAPYPLAITGQLILTFEPDAVNPSDDPAVQFAAGGRTVNFAVPAEATEAAFPAPTMPLQTGTVAGTITLRATFRAGDADMTPSPAPVKVSRILRSAPVIRSVQVERTASGFDLVIKGFSTPRQVTQATFRFTAAAGANLQTTEISLPLTSLADAWFQGAESRQYGSQFTLRQPFTVQGDTRAASAVSVTLANSVGASQAASAGL